MRSGKCFHQEDLLCFLEQCFHEQVQFVFLKQDMLSLLEFYSTC